MKGAPADQLSSTCCSINLRDSKWQFKYKNILQTYLPVVVQRLSKADFNGNDQIYVATLDNILYWDPNFYPGTNFLN